MTIMGRHMMTTTRWTLGMACAGFMGLAACASSQQSAEAPEAASGEAAQAVEAPAAEAMTGSDGKVVEVVFQSKSGSQLAGTAKLTEASGGVQVELSLQNVAPGEHGAHVHETGDCSAPDASSAGSHFNPASTPHALPEASPRHLGDLGNISIGEDGTGTLEIVAPGANLQEGDPSSFLGKAIVIHEKADDGGQPVGNAGGRIGCAEIR